MKSRLLLTGCAALMAAAMAFDANSQGYENTKEWWRRYKEQKEAINAHMKRYGINREDITALRRLRETWPPYSEPHTRIPAEEFLNPGEHYRFELDEYIINMLVPTHGKHDTGQWIYPYVNTHAPDAAMKEYLEQEKGSLPIASLGWYNCVFFGCMNSRGDVSGVTMTYRILSPEEISGKFSTPENLRKGQIEWNQYLIKQAQTRYGSNPIISRAEEEAYQIAINPEIVTINGRVWVRYAMNMYMTRDYHYLTTLSPGRMLSVRFGMPNGHDYNAQPDPSTWPGSAKKAYANMEKMAASLRVSKIDDDGSPDPFVVERVEPAPLPVREPLPSSQ
ncbi:MAG TPA: hypothetical protein GXX56_12540 [Rhodocyclaceae bacterium]|jgi:hypothetical protein|nr:hypothetical protein [Rhodocyclaceae bacterium]